MQQSSLENKQPSVVIKMCLIALVPDDVTTPSNFLVFGTRKIIPTTFLLILVGTLIMLAAALLLPQLPAVVASSDF